MDTPLVKKLKKLWNSKSPFVFFRLPKSKKVTVYFQKNNKLHITDNLNCSGFLMAPFDIKNQIPFIPEEFSKNYELNRTKVLDQTKSELVLDSKNKDSFKNLVEKAKKNIESGKIKKVVVSQTQKVVSRRNIISIFQDLLYNYPLAMVYLWHHPSIGTWFGASPEQFIKTKGNISQTMALAGTQIFDENKPTSWSNKEVEEQELVAIQVEKDLKVLFPNKQIQKSSVFNHRAGNLVHLCTYFRFPKLKGNLFEVAQGLHPTPAVGGVPKKEAQKFIFTNETYDRSFYTGFLGPTSKFETQLFVNLRCASWTPKITTIYVGAGITLNSNAEKEWFETQRKAKTILKVL